MLRRIIAVFIVLTVIAYAYSAFIWHHIPFVPIVPIRPPRPSPIVSNDDYQFDGASSIEHSNAKADTTNRMVIEFQIKTSASQGFVFSMGDISVPPKEPSVLAFLNNGILYLIAGSDTHGFSVGTPSAIAPSQNWTRVGIVRDGETWTLRIDDKDAASRTKQFRRVPSNTVRFGNTPAIDVVHKWTSNYAINGLVGCVRNATLNGERVWPFVIYGTVKRAC